MSIQIIKTPNGDELVVLPRAEYDALVAGFDPEDAADVAAFDAAMSALNAGATERLPPEVSAFLTSGDRRLKAVRKWRGLSQVELAGKAGIGQGYLSDVESGRRSGSPATIDAIALALDVPKAWID